MIKKDCAVHIKNLQQAINHGLTSKIIKTSQVTHRN